MIAPVLWTLSVKINIIYNSHDSYAHRDKLVGDVADDFYSFFRFCPDCFTKECFLSVSLFSLRQAKSRDSSMKY